MHEHNQKTVTVKIPVFCLVTYGLDSGWLEVKVSYVGELPQ